MNLLVPERLDALARAYALGTLHGAARRRFERLLRESAAARAATVRWQETFATLTTTLPPMSPRGDVWRGIEQRLGFASASAPRAATA